LRIRDQLPKKGRKTDEFSGDPVLPAELEGALQSLYSNYVKYFHQWQKATDPRGVLREVAANGSRSNDFSRFTPPVFIVVCNNTNVSKMVFDYIAGWEKKLPDGTMVNVPGKLELFSNVADGRWSARPNTILIDSQQLESGEGMSADFKKIASVEIEEFKDEYRARFPGRDAGDLTDEDILREVMNTVGKPGKLGEQVRCVVSVSMLTEGWDASTVTHILGVRAFGTQLLCEQVVGRGLRRRSYATNADGKFEPDYAEVYGVPFSFIPSAGSASEPKPGPAPTRVRALADRIACELTFPRLVGYRYELQGEHLDVKFTPDSCMAISTADLPTETEMSSIIGESDRHTIYGLKDRRLHTLDFELAKLVLERKLQGVGEDIKPWLFPQLLDIARRWREQCLTCKDDTFPQMLFIEKFKHDAAEKIYQTIVASTSRVKVLLPILRPFDTLGSTRYVDFDTTRDVYRTRPDKCHISHVVLDSGWEAKLAETLEEMDEVLCYAKNFQLGFTIPYTFSGQEHAYIPDYLIRIKLPSPTGGRAGESPQHGDDGDLLNLILEVSGEAKKEKAAKVSTARTLWVPAVNNHGGFGHWAFIEIVDPWDAKNTIRSLLQPKGY
jgi:type III restriction enzyme